MTWQETHRRWQALREIEQTSRLDPTGEVPWNDDYASIFGDRDHLVAALRYRWNLALEAQVDHDLDPDIRAELVRALRERNAGILRILARYPARVPTHADRGGRLVHAS